MTQYYEAHKKSSMRVNAFVPLTILLLSSTACSRQNSEPASDRESMEAANSIDRSSAGGDGEWTYGVRMDPISDDRVAFASATLTDGPFSVETEVECLNGNINQYRFSFFDQNGEGAVLRKSNGNVGEVRIRVDSDEAFFLLSSDDRFSNQATLSANDPDLGGGTYQTEYASALSGQSVMFRFELMTGDVTLTVNQSEPAIIRALRECRAALNERVAYEEAKLEAEEATEEFEATQLSPSETNTPIAVDDEQPTNQEGDN